ncbi:MAG: PAAR domain-containing protein [Polyangiaceae bacterium]|nr:PAAR domain-containing protein [Polyangiaceae bacterium]
MSVTPLEAARLGDEIGHTCALKGLLLGLALGAAIVAVGIVAAGATVATGGAAAVLIGGAIATVAGTGLAGMKIGSIIDAGPSGPIMIGSPNTFLGDAAIPAARATLDTVACKDHAIKLIAEGSLTVFINQAPAARRTDKTVCSGPIREGQPDVFFGGPKGTYLPLESEVPGWLVTTLEWAAIIGSVIATGGAIFTVGIGAALGGFALGYIGGELGTKYGGDIGYAIGGDKGRVVGEVIGEQIGSALGGKLGEWGGARIESSLPSSVLAKLPGSTATTTLQARMANPDNFAPGENPAFWTGPGSRDAALANGNSTMENTLGGQSTEAFVNGQNMAWEQSKPVWVESSTNYANQVASQYGTGGPRAGEPVTVYVSDAANPNSVYFTTEKPILQAAGVNIVEVVVPAPPPSP